MRLVLLASFLASAVAVGGEPRAAPKKVAAKDELKSLPANDAPVAPAPAPVLAPAPLEAAPAPLPPQPAPAVESGGLLTKWWLWTAVGVVVVGGMTAGALYVGRPQPRGTTLKDGDFQ